MQPEFSPKLPRLTVFVFVVVVISHLVLFCVLSKDPGREYGLEKLKQPGGVAGTDEEYLDDLFRLGR